MTYEAEAALRLQKLLDRMRRLSREQRVLGLSHREFFTLRVLCERPAGESLRMGELARLLDVPLPSLSKAIQSLEERGWVERRVDPANRRNILVSATPAGREMARQADADAEFSVRKLFTSFGEDETKTFLHLCTRLVDLVEEQEKEGKERKECSNSFAE